MAVSRRQLNGIRSRHNRAANSSLSQHQEAERLGEIFDLGTEEEPDLPPLADAGGGKEPELPTDISTAPGLTPGLPVAPIAPTAAVDAKAYAALVEQAEDLPAIKDTAACAVAERVFSELKAAEDAIHLAYDRHVERAHATWKELTSERRVLLEPIEVARKALGGRVATWLVQVKTEEERVRRQAEEAARIEQLQTAEREAVRAEQQGDGDAAAEIREEARTAPTPIVAAGPSRAPQTGLTTTRQVWVGNILDWPTLRADIGAGKYPELDDLLQAAIGPFLNKLASTLKGDLGKKYPGTEGRQKASLSAR